MLNSESEQKAQHVESSGQSDAVIRLDPSQAERLARVLSRAFHEKPHLTYVLPDERERRAALPWLLRSVIHACHVAGENYTTADIGGGAHWIGPGRTSTLEQVLRTGVRSLPFKLSRESLGRCMVLGARLAWVRQQLARSPHWYLIALGVDPSKQGKGIGAALIEPMLARADYDGLSCYLETFDEPNLAFFEECGFRIQGSGHICRHGPAFWAMVRAPHRRLQPQ